VAAFGYGSPSLEDQKRDLLCIYNRVLMSVTWHAEKTHLVSGSRLFATIAAASPSRSQILQILLPALSCSAAAAALFAGLWTVCTTWRGAALSYLSFSPSTMQMRRHIDHAQHNGG
jgi:hypothetical protein